MSNGQSFNFLSLQPTAVFCCCAPRCVRLRGVVFCVSWIQTVYGLLVLLLSIIYGAAAVSSMITSQQWDPGSAVLLALEMAASIIVGGFFFTMGEYGILATSSLESIWGQEPAALARTRACCRLYVLAYCIASPCSIAMATLRTVGLAASGTPGPEAAVILSLSWVSVAATVFFGAYYVYIVWSYSSWLHMAAREGDSSLLARAVKIREPPQAAPAARAKKRSLRAAAGAVRTLQTAARTTKRTSGQPEVSPAEAPYPSSSRFGQV